MRDKSEAMKNRLKAAENLAKRYRIVDCNDWNIDRLIVFSSERQYQISPGSESKKSGPSGRLKRVMLEEANEPDNETYVEALKSTALRFMDEMGKIVYRGIKKIRYTSQLVVNCFTGYPSAFKYNFFNPELHRG